MTTPNAIAMLSAHDAPTMEYLVFLKGLVRSEHSLLCTKFTVVCVPSQAIFRSDRAWQSVRPRGAPDLPFLLCQCRSIVVSRRLVTRVLPG